ncbi:hypothetical protein XENOCAPTIV_023252 [Xenoophorus captivus]|uniref:Uncharacterized protein n=1 Tax=Xenoophorus captivus TaxID=1517983 RepID=A0ABV0RS09_9TELE
MIYKTLCKEIPNFSFSNTHIKSGNCYVCCSEITKAFVPMCLSTGAFPPTWQLDHVHTSCDVIAEGFVINHLHCCSFFHGYFQIYSQSPCNQHQSSDLCVSVRLFFIEPNNHGTHSIPYVKEDYHQS